MATSKPPWSQYVEVAAIFKIANGKDYQEIPNNLSKDAQDFIELCLQRDPTTRPTALQLLQHPFIQYLWWNQPNSIRLMKLHLLAYMEGNLWQIQLQIFNLVDRKRRHMIEITGLNKPADLQRAHGMKYQLLLYLNRHV
ncbi:serine/threonine-protein kinase 10-like isoform X2 [Hibiscus syriacus]|uniref:serine/threonine-protein kinase 10-like isoform X2 n=1 Tax=Hibiscus syriacus TaxID=106335 RepID=UPI001924518B|nr:serine/threonine-protein kinase 10-like isoform X2 [Hibiscus syriacus]